MEIERGNIIAAFRFVIQELLDYASFHQLSAVSYNEQCKCPPSLFEIVKRLLCIIDNGICHGISLHTQSSDSVSCPDPWPIICSLEGENEVLVNSVNALNEVKTGLGKTRLWVWNALMSKKIGSFIRKMIEEKKTKKTPTARSELDVGKSSSESYCLVGVYAKGALLVSDEGLTFADLLSTLSNIDFCFDIKGNLCQLDGPLSPIDYRLCIRLCSGAPSIKECSHQNKLENRLSSVLEQKCYLEETMSASQSQLDKLIKDVAELKSENLNLRTSKADIEAEVLKLERENNRLSELLANKSKDARNDLEAIRETFKQFSTSLDAQNAELEKQLSEEKKQKLGIEKLLSHEKETRLALEAELLRLKAVNSKREDDLTEHRNYIADMVALNKEFAEKLKCVSSELEASKKSVSDLHEKINGMSSELAAVKERCDQLTVEKAASEKSLQEALHRANQADRLCVHLRADLEANREITQNLQSHLDEVYGDLANVQALQENLDRKSQSLRERDAMLNELQRRYNEAERSLAEMARAVEAARLQADHAEERVNLLAAAQWTNDSDVNACTLCASPFSFSRRKHHCRNCGLIFCHECSAFKMSLPSSSKPVRVCETCHNQLMHRYSAR